MTIILNNVVIYKAENACLVPADYGFLETYTDRGFLEGDRISCRIHNYSISAISNNHALFCISAISTSRVIIIFIHFYWTLCFLQFPDVLFTGQDPWRALHSEQCLQIYFSTSFSAGSEHAVTFLSTAPFLNRIRDMIKCNLSKLWQVNRKNYVC